MIPGGFNFLPKRQHVGRQRVCVRVRQIQIGHHRTGADFCRLEEMLTEPVFDFSRRILREIGKIELVPCSIANCRDIRTQRSATTIDHVTAEATFCLCQSPPTHD